MQPSQTQPHRYNTRSTKKAESLLFLPSASKPKKPSAKERRASLSQLIAVNTTNSQTTPVAASPPHHHAPAAMPHHYNVDRYNEVVFLPNTGLQQQPQPQQPQQQQQPDQQSSFMIMRPVLDPAELPWHSPLCNCTSATMMTRYAFACLCPCSLVTDISKKLLCPLQPSSSSSSSLSSLPLSRVFCNCFSCFFLPCMALYNGLYTVPSFTWHVEQPPPEPEEEEEESCCDASLLSHICFIDSQSRDEDPHFDVEEPLLHEPLYDKAKFTATTLCLSTLCIAPTTCLLRHITTVNYHPPHAQESLWMSGLVSCFAWPCALVQTMDEINMANHHYFAEHTMQ